MRTAKIASLDEANAFLPAFVADRNTRYALDESSLQNVFAAGPTGKELSIALSVVSERKVHSGSYISYKNQHYVPFDNRERVLLRSGAKVYVLKTLDDELYLVKGESIWPLLNLETRSLPTPKDLKGTIYTPPKDHPWKEANYKMLLEKVRRAS